MCIWWLISTASILNGKDVSWAFWVRWYILILLPWIDTLCHGQIIHNKSLQYNDFVVIGRQSSCGGLFSIQRKCVILRPIKSRYLHLMTYRCWIKKCCLPSYYIYILKKRPSYHKAEIILPTTGRFINRCALINNF